MRLNSFSIRLYKSLEEHKYKFIFIPLIVYWITLFVLTTIPTDAIPHFFSSQDKFEHLIAYFVLGIFLNFALHFQTKSSTIKLNSFVFSIVFIMVYGILDEAHQLFIPGRQADVLDWLFDTIGGSIGVILISIFLKKLKSAYNDF
jgi:VanZ family protein